MDKTAPFNQNFIYLEKRPFGTEYSRFRGMQALITDDEEA